MKYTKWEHKRRIEEAYAASLKKLVKKILGEITGKTDIGEITDTLYAIYNSSELKSFALAKANTMVTHLFTDNAKTWREAARIGGRGQEIQKLLREELQGPIGSFFYAKIQENAGYIRNIPLAIAQEITDKVARETAKGVRYEDMVADIQKRLPHISEKRAELIARTEVGKTSTAITEARSRELNIRWYIWRTSGDGRVRDSHAHMNGVLIPFNDPPAPERLIGRKEAGRYHAGDIWNCRCYPEPIVDLRFVRFPARVYYRGEIVTMTKQAFMKIA